MANYNSQFTGSDIDGYLDDTKKSGVGRSSPDTVLSAGANLSDQKMTAAIGTDNCDDQPVATAAGAAFVVSRNNTSRVNFFAQTSDLESTLYIRAISETAQGVSPWAKLWSDQNTTVDGSGFIKEASPIIKLFHDKIEKNNQVGGEVTFQKLGVGDYLISNTSGFAKKGWYIETPKDANGNIKVFIEYSEAAGDISIKTYEPDYTMGKVQPSAPMDIPPGRWIDIRLQKDETI